VVRNGSLAALIKDRKKEGRPFSEQEIAVMMKAILQGVAHIHSLNIIHRDLKTCMFSINNLRKYSGF
jgi:serine/threonine protein kinase